MTNDGEAAADGTTLLPLYLHKAYGLADRKSFPKQCKQASVSLRARDCASVSLTQRLALSVTDLVCYQLL